MAREKSWFVAFTKKPAGSVAITATSLAGYAGRGDVGRLANQLSAGVNIGGIDPDTERDPPARATPLVFPEVARASTARWSSDHPPPNFQQLFASIQRPEDWLSKHLLALNCDRQFPCSSNALLPPRDDGTSYIPAKSSTDKKFAERVAELDITNDAAFRALSKTTKPGEKAPRFLYMRKFWIFLDNMAQYWDKSADEYYLTEVPTDPNKPGYDMFTKDVERYKGRRIGSGSDMPDKFRADTVTAFVEGVTAAFNCRISPPYIAPRRFAPTMQVNKLEQPVRLTSVVMRLPTDRDKIRARTMEGPVMGVLERNTTNFNDTSGRKLSPRKSEHDLLREIAAMLLLAQQRAHEQQGPDTQTEEKWYSTKPRWGGGSGSKMPAVQRCEDEYKEILARIADATSETPDLEPQRLDAKKKLQKAQHIAKKWTTLQGSMSSLWDGKTDYMAIGKPPGSPYDQVSITLMTKHWLD